MTKLRQPFNWSDAWLLLAISLASETGPATLETIIASGDRINFAIFRPDELESGLVRLAEAGYISEKSGSFSLTEKMQPLAESFAVNQPRMDQRLVEVQQLLGAAAAPDEQPCKNNLKYPGFTKEQYEEAVRNYQGYLR